MMTSIHKILAVTLVMQAGLATATWWPRGGGEVAARPLLTLSEVTSIEITGRTTSDQDAPEPLRLVRQGEGWVLPDLHGYPADPDKVEELLGRLQDLQVRAPIATQASSHRALQVADDTFTRRVRLTSGGQTVELYLGAASGQAVHLRRGDSGEVFASRGLSAWSVADSARRYYDPVFLSVDPEDVRTLAVTGPTATLALERTEDGWTAPDLPEGHAIDAAEADRLLRKLMTLRLEEVVGAEPDPAWGLTDGVAVAWTTEAGSGSYTIGALEDDKRWVMADDRPHVVRVRGSSLEAALDARLDDLLRPLERAADH